MLLLVKWEILDGGYTTIPTDGSFIIFAYISQLLVLNLTKEKILKYRALKCMHGIYDPAYFHLYIFVNTD